jgi:hypothetical protein
MEKPRTVFSAWFGSPLPLYAYQCVESFAQHGHATTLFLDPFQSHSSERLASLRALGVQTLETNPYHSLLPLVSKALMPASLEKFGPWPTVSDLFRYQQFTRGRDQVWVDCDSFCLQPLTAEIPDSFVATEPVRHAYPFRRFGLLSDAGPYCHPQDLKAWFESSKDPRLITNSHCCLEPALATKLVSKMRGDLENSKQKSLSDHGMTCLRRLVSQEGLWSLARPSVEFNPLPAWRVSDFESLLFLDSKLQEPRTKVLHVCNSVRRRLTSELDFSRLA